MDYFGAMYQEATGGDAYLEYNPTGSGSGRTNFVAGQVVFAGSDSPLEEDQRSEEHTSELQSRGHLVCRLLLEKKKLKTTCWSQRHEVTNNSLKQANDLD